jgi:hypothetical protein
MHKKTTVGNSLGLNLNSAAAPANPHAAWSCGLWPVVA